MKHNQKCSKHTLHKSFGFPCSLAAHFLCVNGSSCSSICPSEISKNEWLNACGMISVNGRWSDSILDLIQTRSRSQQGQMFVCLNLRLFFIQRCSLRPHSQGPKSHYEHHLRFLPSVQLSINLSVYHLRLWRFL